MQHHPLALTQMLVESCAAPRRKPLEKRKGPKKKLDHNRQSEPREDAVGSGPMMAAFTSKYYNRAVHQAVQWEMPDFSTLLNALHARRPVANAGTGGRPASNRSSIISETYVRIHKRTYVLYVRSSQLGSSSPTARTSSMSTPTSSSASPARGPTADGYRVSRAVRKNSAHCALAFMSTPIGGISALCRRCSASAHWRQN